MRHLSRKDHIHWDDHRFAAAFQLFLKAEYIAALACYDQILAESPTHPRAMHAKGVVLHCSGQTDTGIALILKSIALKHDYFDAIKNLGGIYQSIGNHDAAKKYLALYLSEKPDDVIAARKYITVLSQLKKYPEVRKETVKLHTFTQSQSEDFIVLGEADLAAGDAEQARRNFRKACAQLPCHENAFSNLLYTLNLCDTSTQKQIYQVSRRWGKQFDTREKTAPFSTTADPDKRLRIGYVSGDFKLHPVSYHLEPVLAHHDKNKFEIFLYSNFLLEDEMSERIRELADHWISIATMSDDELEALVRFHGIDVLIDLSGHTAYNRLSLFIRKVAPIQVSWLGYFNTLGLSCIDYLITDALTILPAEELWFSEKILRLPVSRFCYKAPEFAPHVAPLPAKSNGYITFGSFNRLEKISPQTVTLWATILKMLPDSRLIIKSPGIENPCAVRRLSKVFKKSGIAANRLEFRINSPHPLMLAEYKDVDIALDTSPFNGGATTCEALWMGVPVVTLPGNLPISRQSAAILAATDNAAFVADSIANFCKICLDLASDFDSLAEIRAALRKKMKYSFFCNGKRFTRNMETLLRQVWHEWCSRC